jgi:hypothetical protein
MKTRVRDGLAPVPVPVDADGTYRTYGTNGTQSHESHRSHKSYPWQADGAFILPVAFSPLRSLPPLVRRTS